MEGRALLESMPFDVKLRDALRERLQILPDHCAQYAVLGAVPKCVASPSGPDEAALIVKTAASEGASIIVRGAGTKLHRPPRPHAVDIVVDMRGCSGIVEHAAADLTVTVRAGTRLAEIDDALAQAGQFWPCDAPFADTATLGGTLAANASGALRQRYGGVRDLVLGARFVGAQGTFVRAGARVVKSVAGYDIHKLLIGSRGSLAIVAEATLKVAPLPESERTLLAAFADPAGACESAQTIANAPLFPMATTLHDAASARRVGALVGHIGADAWLLAVRCGGNRRSVARQIFDAAAACRAAGAANIADLDRGSTRRAWNGIRELAAGAAYPAEGYVALKIVGLPSAVPAVLSATRETWPDAELTAHPWAGAVFVHLPAGAGPDDARGDASHFDSRVTAQLFQRCVAPGWSAAVLQAPAASADGLPPDVAPGMPIRLFRAIKASLDPAGVFDPGRMPGGV